MFYNDDMGYLDVAGFAEAIDAHSEPVAFLGDDDLKAVKASTKTWADLYTDDEGE